MLGADDLPESAEELHQLVLKQRAALAERDGIIERLKAQLAWLRRQQFGRSSEKIEREIEQLELQLEDLEETSSARISTGTFGRPPRARDFHRQYRRNPSDATG